MKAKAQIIVFAVLLSLAACSNPEEQNSGGKISTLEDKTNTVAPAQAAQAKPERKGRQSSLHRHLLEGSQEKERGLGLPDKKRSE